MSDLFILDTEKILNDDYPVYWDYIYLCDSIPVKSDIKGTIKDLKRDLREFYKLPALEIRNCDIMKRSELLKDKGV